MYYVEESWIGKSKHRVEGVVYDMGEQEGTGDEPEFTRVRDVPAARVRAKIEGSWMSQIYYTITGSKVGQPGVFSGPNSNEPYRTSIS